MSTRGTVAVLANKATRSHATLKQTFQKWVCMLAMDPSSPLEGCHVKAAAIWWTSAGVLTEGGMQRVGVQWYIPTHGQPRGGAEPKQIRATLGHSDNRINPPSSSSSSDQDEIYEQVALLTGHKARGINCHSAAAARLSKELTYSLLQEDIKAMVPSAASLL